MTTDPTSKPHLDRPALKRYPPRMIAGQPIPSPGGPHTAYTPPEAEGCGCLIAALVAFAVCLAAILGSGCAPRYTVVPADREVVPIRATVPDAAANRRTYVEDADGATGWYVPDAVMLELMEAD